MNELIKTGEKQDIDGFTGYVINADDLLEISIFDIIKVNYNGKFYCIPLSNETSHDNIIICCNNKDIAAHMAKSVVYKNIYPDNNNLNNTLSKVENMTSDLQSLANEYANGTDLQSLANEYANSADLQSLVNDYAKGDDLNNVKSSIENQAGDLLSKSPVRI